MLVRPRCGLAVRRYDRWSELEAHLNAAGYRLYPLNPVDARFPSGRRPPRVPDLFRGASPSTCAGRPLPEMEQRVGDVDVLAVHRDLAGATGADFWVDF